MPNGTGDGVVWKKEWCAAFDVLVTVDQGIEYEQNLANRRMAVLIIPAALAALRSIHPGRAIRVGAK